MTRNTTNSTRKMKKQIFAIPAAPDETCVKPKNPAMTG